MMDHLHKKNCIWFMKEAFLMSILLLIPRYNDMVDMEVINDAELLVNLKKRYEKNLIFTYVGPTLLVVNPFKAIPNLVS